VFSWSASSDPDGVVGYTLQISTNANFSAPVFSSSTVGTSAHMSLYQGIWYWVVNAGDTAGNYSAWSSTWTVCIDSTPPTQVNPYFTPANNSFTNVRTVPFSWSASTAGFAGVNSYIVEASTSPLFAGIIYSTVTSNTSASMTLNQSTYTWRVNVVDNALNYTTSTLNWTVTVDTTPPAQVTTYYTPTNNTFTSQETVAFSWSASTDSPAGVNSYIVEVSTSPTFSGIIFSSITTSTNASMTLNSSSYTWCVNVVDNAMNYTSSTLHYTIDISTSQPPGVSTLISPANNFVINLTTVNFSWQSIVWQPGVQDYILQVSTAPDMSVINYSSSTNTTAATLSLPEGSYTWRVNVLDYVQFYTTSTVQYALIVDTTPPSVTDNQSGDYTWRSSSGTMYNVTFQDDFSGVTTAQYRIYDSSNNLVVPWTTIFGGTTPYVNYSSMWAISAAAFNALQGETTNYVYVQCNDAGGNLYSDPSSVFFVLKDTIAPANINNLTMLSGPFSGTVSLSWTAPGDDGMNITNSRGLYVIKYAPYPLTTDPLFAAATNTWTMIPSAAPGNVEGIVITGLSINTTYYFGIHVYDKANNTSALAYTGGMMALNTSIYINEFCPTAGGGNCWVELYNNTPNTYSLYGSSLVYNLGTISSPGSQSYIWTGGAGSSIVSGGYLLIGSLTLDSVSSHYIMLKDSASHTVDIVQWPGGMPAGSSLSRIRDGDPNYFEINPTPTKGYANAISTGNVKINEIDYASSHQSIEFYNVGGSTLAPAYISLRNSHYVIFQSSRTINPQGFSGLDASSVSSDSKTWTTCFGSGGLNPSSDYLVLENESGQVEDRITWGTISATQYYNYQAQLQTYNLETAGNITAPSTLIRQTDGVDTGNNSVDVIVSAGPSLGMTNKSPTLLPNVLSYPGANGMSLPYLFLFNMTLGSNSSGGTTNDLWFVQTAGTSDPHSPHIFHLSKWGILPNTLTQQTTVQLGTTVSDIDGHSLVNGSVYSLLLNTDNGSNAAPQTVRTGITYDATIQSVQLNSILQLYSNNNVKTGLFKITLYNNSPAGGNTIELNQVSLQLKDGSGAPLNVQNVFTDMYLLADNPNAGTVGSYQTAIDTAVLGHLASVQLTSSSLTIPVANPNSSTSQISPQTNKIFFIAANLTSNANTFNGFQAQITPGLNTSWQDAISSVTQPATTGSLVSTSSQTIIIPLAQSSGFPAAVVPAGSGINVSAIDSSSFTYTYCATSSGTIFAVNASGNPLWSFNVGGTINSIYDATMDEGREVIYAASTNGTLVKIDNNGVSASQEWSQNLGASISSDIYEIPGSYLYAATTAGNLYEMNLNGVAVSGAEWDQNPGYTGGLFGTPIIDNFSQGVNAMWYPSSDGTFYRINDFDGSITVPVSISAAAITTWPWLLAGYGNTATNTHVLYFGDNGGYFRARNSNDLVTNPWTQDVHVSSPILSSPYFDGAQYFYFGADNGTFYQVDANNGAIDGTFHTNGPIRSNPIVGSDNDVYFGSDDGCLYGLDTDTLTLLPGFPIVTGGEIRTLNWAQPDVGPPLIYFYSNDGKGYCVAVEE
jgi:hypothetical protein